MGSIKAACVQMRSGRDIDANIAAASRLIRQAAGAGAQLIATPEMTSHMDRVPGAAFSAATVERYDRTLEEFTALAAELGIWLLLGSIAVRPDAAEKKSVKCLNRSYLLDPTGRIAARYDKIHMFDVELGRGGTYRESDSYLPGTQAIATDITGAWGRARIGMTICYDLRFPHLYRALAKTGAEILTVPSAFTKVTGEAHWHVLLRARAIETGAWVLAPAQGGLHDDGRETYGHSLIVDPWGGIVAEAEGDAPGVIMADVDLDLVAQVRRKIPSLKVD